VEFSVDIPLPNKRQKTISSPARGVYSTDALGRSQHGLLGSSNAPLVDFRGNDAEVLLLGLRKKQRVP